MQPRWILVAIASVFGSLLAGVPARAQRAIDTRAAAFTFAQGRSATSPPARGNVHGLDPLSPIAHFDIPIRPDMASMDQDKPDLRVNAAAAPRSRGHNALIGAGIGAAIGAGIGVALSIPSSGEGSMIPPPLIIAGGALAGGVIGALIGAVAHTGP